MMLVCSGRWTGCAAHGVTRNPDDLTNLDEGPWHYEMLELGLNYRMTDMQAALGLSQMQRFG